MIFFFQLASRAEMEPRAKELIETIASSQLIPLVCKYARKINRVHLAESLSALLGTFQDQVSLYAISLCKCCRSAHRSSLCCIGFENVACDVAHACAIFRSRFRRFSPPKCDV